jgi:hypothetical protein
LPQGNELYVFCPEPEPDCQRAGHAPTAAEAAVGAAQATLNHLADARGTADV